MQGGFGGKRSVLKGPTEAVGTPASEVESRQLTHTVQSVPASGGPREKVQAMFHSGESDHPQILVLRLRA